MKDKILNVPATLDMVSRKNHKTQISFSVFCFLLESNKITHLTGNDFSMVSQAQIKRL